MRLVIFDLDQTLVDLISVHDEATRELFSKFFGVDARLTEIDFAGKNLIDNFSELARLKGVPEEIFQKNVPQLLGNYETAFIKRLPKDAKNYVIPGARELLSALSKTAHVIALYTGNSGKIARAVLKVTGLGKYFRLCFYGTEVKSRADMVGLAAEKAEKLAGQQFKSKDIVVIGDSIRDVESGKAYDALSIAVATGFHSRAQLRAAGADFIFDGVKEWREILEAMG